MTSSWERHWRRWPSESCGWTAGGGGCDGGGTDRFADLSTWLDGVAAPAGRLDGLEESLSVGACLGVAAHGPEPCAALSPSAPWPDPISTSTSVGQAAPGRPSTGWKASAAALSSCCCIRAMAFRRLERYTNVHAKQISTQPNPTPASVIESVSGLARPPWPSSCRRRWWWAADGSAGAAALKSSILFPFVSSALPMNSVGILRFRRSQGILGSRSAYIAVVGEWSVAVGSTPTRSPSYRMRECASPRRRSGGRDEGLMEAGGEWLRHSPHRRAARIPPHDLAAEDTRTAPRGKAVVRPQPTFHSPYQTHSARRPPPPRPMPASISCPRPAQAGTGGRRGRASIRKRARSGRCTSNQ